MKHATCVGSRNITIKERRIATALGYLLASMGYVVRSGNADGADKAFQEGAATYSTGTTEVFLPWNGFNKPYVGHTYLPNFDAMSMAKQVLIDTGVAPYIDKIKDSIQKLYCRNYYQVVGTSGQASDICFYIADLDVRGSVKGGTRVAVELCQYYGIQTINLRRLGESTHPILEELIRTKPELFT